MLFLYYKQFVICTIILVVAGCAQPVHHQPLSKEKYDFQHIADTGEGKRWWGDTKPLKLDEYLKKQAKALKQRFPSAVTAKDKSSAPDFDSLTISGGGADGAFGAGILIGWTKSGKRPEFELVIGTSTGAVIAPFAFLGPKYDATLYKIYSQLTKDKVYSSQVISGLLGGSSFADTKSLKQQIDKFITLELIKAIAQEHRKARDLMVVTTHFDAMRPMIWDIGAIASEENEEAVLKIRKIILASASIPVYFPPVTFERQMNGQSYTELHVDGSLTRNAFAYPAQINISYIEKVQGLIFNRNIYVIQNSNSKIQFEESKTDLSSIALRSILGLLQDKINSDIERIYYLSQRDKLNFNMIEIPSSFVADKAIEFDTEYINKLLDLGTKLGESGNFWYSKPPSERD